MKKLDMKKTDRWSWNEDSNVISNMIPNNVTIHDLKYWTWNLLMYYDPLFMFMVPGNFGRHLKPSVWPILIWILCIWMQIELVHCKPSIMKHQLEVCLAKFGIPHIVFLKMLLNHSKIINQNIILLTLFWLDMCTYNIT